eukprot:gene21424-biopygen13
MLWLRHFHVEIKSPNYFTWACSKETHEKSGFHYHMAIKFSESNRWLKAKTHLQAKHNIIVHFSEGKLYHNYFSAYKYVTKEDKEALHSDGHPDLTSATSPRTSKSSKKLMCKKRERSANRMEPVDGIDHQPGPSRPPKARRLSNLDVADVIITKTITDEMGLYALANEQKLEGKTDLANFVFGKGNKGVNELILQAWKMNDSARKIERGKVTRMERIESAVTG